MTNHQPGLDRRTLLLGTALAPLTALGLADVAAATGIPSRFGELFRRIRYRSDDGVLFWWMTGNKYGQIQNEVRPFHGLEACAIIRITSTADGWTTESLEHTFYTDPDTGRPLESMTNPFTGEVMNYQRRPAQPLTLQYNADGSLELPSEFGGARFESDRAKTVLASNADEIWLSDDATTKLTRGEAAPVHSADWSTFRCTIADLAASSRRFVPASLHLQALSGWQGWMNMAGQDGGLISRIAGAKFESFDEVPETWRAMLAEAHPDVARDPVGSLDPK